MDEAPSAYPLAWPVGRPRRAAHLRKNGQFAAMEMAGGGYRHVVGLTLDQARERLARELDRLSARQTVLSMNIEFRLDGSMRASSSAKPRDPGVAVYFHLASRPTVLACDAFTEVPQNIAAIAATIEAMRKIERYGATTTEQVFTGFLALPAPMVVDDWREVLGNPMSLEGAEWSFRTRMKSAHPDLGGSHTEAARLTAAITRAREELR